MTYQWNNLFTPIKIQLVDHGTDSLQQANVGTWIDKRNYPYLPMITLYPVLMLCAVMQRRGINVLKGTSLLLCPYLLLSFLPKKNLHQSSLEGMTLPIFIGSLIVINISTTMLASNVKLFLQKRGYPTSPFYTSFIRSMINNLCCQAYYDGFCTRILMKAYDDLDTAPITDELNSQNDHFLFHAFQTLSYGTMAKHVGGAILQSLLSAGLESTFASLLAFLDNPYRLRIAKIPTSLAMGCAMALAAATKCIIYSDHSYEDLLDANWLRISVINQGISVFAT